MAKDWKGDSNSVYKTLGASNHCSEEREENDFYQPKVKKFVESSNYGVLESEVIFIESK